MNAQDKLRNRKAILTFLLPFWVMVLPALVALVASLFQGNGSLPEWSLFATFIGGMICGGLAIYMGFLLIVRSGLIEEEQRALQRRAVTPPDDYVRGIEHDYC